MLWFYDHSEPDFRLPERKLELVPMSTCRLVLRAWLRISQKVQGILMRRFSTRLMAVTTIVVAASMVTGAAQAVTKVAAGNVNAEQPNVPRASANRTNALNTTYERKYQKVLGLLRSDQGLIRDIKSTAKKFDLDPIHIIGAIVGEHTYNVDAFDRAQTYYVKALAYVKNDIDFEHAGESIDDFIARPEFKACSEFESSLDAWICRETVWESTFRGKTFEGQKFPNDRMSAVFFQPFFAGQTFGLGQLNPLTALMMTDRVADVTGARKLDHRDGKTVYRTIMDPKKTLPYIAATLATAIDDYKAFADFDISENPGLTATLYNTGRSRDRAKALAAKNRSGREAVPTENYYGWLINDREEELRSLL